MKLKWSSIKNDTFKLVNKDDNANKDDSANKDDNANRDGSGLGNRDLCNGHST